MAKDIVLVLETSKDSFLMKVYSHVMEGWPNKPVEENIQPFYQRKDQLSTDQGCLLWGLTSNDHCSMYVYVLQY